MPSDTLKQHLPAGTQDYLPAECRTKRALEQILRGVFERAGYDEIETPVFEYYDVFTHDSVPYVQEEIVKFFDRSGHILALRPDVTGSIARMAATKLLPAGDALRLFYIGNVYGIRGRTERVESTQAGVELIGDGGIYADAEVIALAIQALRKLGLTDFSIEIGQVAYFRGLLAGCDLTEEQRERIRSLINDKNSVELEYALSKLCLPSEVSRSLLMLPGLFGDVDSLDQAPQPNAQCTEAIARLRGVIGILSSYGLADCISVDLGLLHDFQYYTGILFRGLHAGIGRPILSGGRYDTLLGEFGMPAPAVGFAIRLTRLLKALKVPAAGQPEKPVCLRFAPEDAQKAWEKAEQLRSTGMRVILAGPQGPDDAVCWNDPALEEDRC